MYTFSEQTVNTNTNSTALLNKPPEQISGSTNGKTGFNQLDRYIPTGTPNIPDTIVIAPNIKEILRAK